jgi:hypothetical protein|tara:strand:- start:255 stop:440 length:186 start_codon:yes stop_codon:yes gene_type:complete
MMMPNCLLKGLAARAKPEEICGCPRISDDIHGYPWLMNIHRYPFGGQWSDGVQWGPMGSKN